MMMKFSGFC